MGCCGIGVEKKKQLLRLTSVEDLQGVDVSALDWGVLHWSAISGNSEALTWGSNQYGQWGILNNQQDWYPRPVLLKSLIHQKVNAVACGAAHTLMVTDTNVVFSWGMNSMGQCGLDSGQKFIYEPMKIQSLLSVDIQGIAWGMGHSIFLDTTGDLYWCGSNSNGQLGYGDSVQNLIKPYRVYLESDAKFNFVACGGCHTVMITKDTGHIYSTGLNSCSQLGLDTTDDVYRPQLIEALADAVKISYAAWGEEFSIFISEQGKVFACGLNNVGQCGISNLTIDEEVVRTPLVITEIENERIESVVCGKGEVMAINNRGVVYKWGLDSIEESKSQAAPTKLTNFKNKEILQISWGRDFFGVLLAATDPGKSFATGKALSSTVKAGKISKFDVITVDKTGFMRISGGDRINVFGINQITGKIINPNEIDIFDNMNGTYEVSMKISQTGSFLLHVLANGHPIQLSPFIIYIKPGDPDPSKSTVEFAPFSQLKETNPPEYRMMAGDTLFFKILFRDKSGALIDKVDDFDSSRLVLKKNGYEAPTTEIMYETILSDYDSSIKARFLSAELQRIEIFYDKHLLKVEIDNKIVSKILNKEVPNISSDKLMLNISSDYAHPTKCIVEYESYHRMPILPPLTLKNDSIKCGVRQQFYITNIDKFGNKTKFIDKVYGIKVSI